MRFSSGKHRFIIVHEPDATLKHEFHTQLNLPRGAAAKGVGRLQGPERISVKIAAWQIEIGMIENVEELGTELQ